jgi:hypothetical protein
VRAERTAAPAIPQVAVFVSAPTGGAAPFGVAGNTSRYRSPVIQIRTRHSVQSTGRTLAQQIYDGLAPGALTDYINVDMNESGPLFIGQNENGAYEWSFNVTCLYDATVEFVAVTFFNPTLLMYFLDD